MPKQEPQSELDQYVSAAQDLREQVRAAHDAVQTLKTERTSLRRELDELKRVRETWLDVGKLSAELTELSKAGVTAAVEQILASLKLAEEKALERFDAVVAICLGEDTESVKQGKATVYSLMRRYIANTKVPIRVLEETHIEMSQETADYDMKMQARDGERSLRKFFGLSFDYTSSTELPILYDSRIPFGIVYLALPPVDDTDTRVVYEFDIRTGAGVTEALKELQEHGRRRYQARKAELTKVPAAFRRKDPK